MGGLGVEYVRALDVCLVRVVGRVTGADIIATALSSARRYPTSKRLWDISEAALDEWPEYRIRDLVGCLEPLAVASPGTHVALVATCARGARVCRMVSNSISILRFPLEIAVFPCRAAALEWLGVMHLPIGA
ncbi:MAG: hypothetical protein JW751_20995 [Polyangiaceae bacterium]|nr:hypothetical protein [Polyangiaceae bacterium]